MGTIAKQSFWGTVVTYAGVLIGIVTTFFVLTRFLTTEEIGLARVLVDTSVLFIGLAGLGTNSSIIRFFPYFKDNGNDHGFFFWMMIVPFFGFIVFAILYWVFHLPLRSLFIEKSPLFVDYYYFVLPMSFFMLYQTIFETCCNVKMRIVIPRAVREMLIRLLTLIVYLLYAFRCISIDGLVIGLCLTYGIAALTNALYALIRGHISLRPDFHFLNRTLVRDYLLYSGFLLLSAITSVLAPSLSSFFITAQLGLNFTGIFAIVTYMAVMVSIPYRSVVAIASPELAEAMKNNDSYNANRLSQQVSNNLLLIGLFLFATIILNQELIFHILPNGDTFATTSNSLIFLGLSQLILATYAISANVLSYSKYYYLSLPLSLLLTVSSLFLNNYLIPLYGMDGAAVANLIAYALYYFLMVLTVWLTTKTTPFCLNELKTLALAVFIFGGNYLFVTFLPIANIWLSAIVRSLIFLGGSLIIAYAWNISPDINAMILKHKK